MDQQIIKINEAKTQIGWAKSIEFVSFTNLAKPAFVIIATRNWPIIAAVTVAAIIIPTITITAVVKKGVIANGVVVNFIRVVVELAITVNG